MPSCSNANLRTWIEMTRAREKRSIGQGENQMAKAPAKKTPAKAKTSAAKQKTMIAAVGGKTKAAEERGEPKRTPAAERKEEKREKTKKK